MTTKAKVFLIIGISLTVICAVIAVIVIFTPVPGKNQIMDGPDMVYTPYITKAEYSDGNGNLMVLEGDYISITAVGENGEATTQSYYTGIDPYNQIKNIATDCGLFEDENLKVEKDTSCEYVYLINKYDEECAVLNLPDLPEETIEIIRQIKEVLTSIPLDSPVTE